jgi:hypothetical protein
MIRSRSKQIKMVIGLFFISSLLQAAGHCEAFPPSRHAATAHTASTEATEETSGLLRIRVKALESGLVPCAPVKYIQDWSFLPLT